MSRKIFTHKLFAPFCKTLFVAAIAGSLVPALNAQEIRIKVVNGRNGKPITNECLNVWIGAMLGQGLLAPTNNEGVIMLYLENGEVTADAASVRACNGNAFVGPNPVPKGADSIFVTGGNYVDCQEWAKVVPGGPLKDALNRAPSYPIKKILKSGVSASNKCGKVRKEAKPGELIIFERPTTFWERLHE